MDVDFDDNDISFSPDVLKRLKKIKPSAFSSSWSSIQGVQPVVLNHRPAQAYDIPIYLYHHIFSDFMALCESCQVDVQDEKFAVDISVEMCKAFDNEDKRKMAFIDIIRNYPSKYSFNANKVGAYETDGHRTVTVEGEDIILAILEVKSEFGKGHGCAFVQATAYYSQHVVDASENQLKHYQKTFCPCLFYIWQKLSASDNNDRRAAVFPYVRVFHSLGSSSSPMSFTYIQRLTDKRPLYVAKLSNTADRLDVDDKAGVKDNVITVMNSFHELGYVHGDLRGENIMIANDGRVKIVDFDWAGSAGQIEYPHFMNPQIRWHSNAQPAKPIQTEHDKYLLDSYFILQYMLGLTRTISDLKIS
ncbi:7145_t:CDS:2 [Ambispora gerdemannii]|uniref:7145_t:CDS:1 n=1 Tax=Ambispora gerdemannii TaxID=144530 RepID=A0A9N9FH61_9GLOM|nr:7145_t:CDS:2 [Ambispora gerdemannii]